MWENAWNIWIFPNQGRSPSCESLNFGIEELVDFWSFELLRCWTVELLMATLEIVNAWWLNLFINESIANGSRLMAHAPWPRKGPGSWAQGRRALYPQPTLSNSLVFPVASRGFAFSKNRSVCFCRERPDLDVAIHSLGWKSSGWETHRAWSLESGCLEPGGLEARATRFGSGHPLIELGV